MLFQQSRGYPRHLCSALKGWKRGSRYAEHKPIEVYRAGVLVNSFSELNLPEYRELLCPNTEPLIQKGVTLKPYFVGNLYYLPLQYAINLVNQGHSRSEAAQIAIDRFAYYGKNNNKRLKDFDKHQFTKHLNRFLDTPNAILVRKSPNH